MTFQSKGSADATGMFKDALERAPRAGRLRDRDDDPPFTGGYGKTVDGTGIFAARCDALPDPERKKGDPDDPRPDTGAAFDDVAAAAEDHLRQVVDAAMRDPDVRKTVLTALLSYDVDATAVAQEAAERVAVDAYVRATSGSWVR